MKYFEKVVISLSIIIILASAPFLFFAVADPGAILEDHAIPHSLDHRTPDTHLQEISIPEAVVEVENRNVQRGSYADEFYKSRRLIEQMAPNIPVPTYDPESIISKIEIERTDDTSSLASSAMLSNNMKLNQIRFGPRIHTASDKMTRSAGADLEITQIEWESKVNTGWGHYTENDEWPGNNPTLGGFMVGVSTQITVTVANHNPTTPVNGINMNFTIIDYYSGIPLIKIPSSVAFNIASTSTKVYFDFTPPAAKSLYIAAYIAYPGDADQLNNGMGYYPIPVLIWAADFEASGYGDGSQFPNAWGGDVGTGNDKWHKTTTAANQNSQDHTTTTSYYHGNETGSPDSYDDSYDLFLESPKIDMGDISDGQADCGILPHGSNYDFAIPRWAGMFTGEAEIDSAGDPDASDVLWTYEIQDDPVTPNWKSPVSKWQGGWVAGNWETIFTGQTVPTWNPNIRFISQTDVEFGWPFDLSFADGSGGGASSNNGAKNWSNVQFRIHLDGDAQGDEGANLPGYYADDFITWGYQKWRPQYNIRLSEVTAPKTNGHPILYPNVGFKFDTIIENMGEALSNVPISVTIKDKFGSNVFGPQAQSVAAIDEDELATKVWSWMPADVGDYIIYIEAGELNKDYSPLLNVFELKVHVRNPNGRVLVVDDDNSWRNGGPLSMKPKFNVDVEDRMLESLDEIDMSYNVYSVGWNESGPTKAIMDRHEAVIWMTGLDNEYDNYHKNPNFGSGWGITFKPEDQTQIASYLNQGNRNIWVISPGVLYDLTNSEGPKSPTGFLKDYLHVIYCNANETEYNDDGDITKRGTPTRLIGEVDTLGAKAEYDTYAYKPDPGFIDAGGVIEADSSTKPILFQNTARTAYNSLQYSNTYNLVYFAFNYYLINEPVDRADLTYRVMRFFGLVGDIDVSSVGSNSKSIGFGETISFTFSIRNNGKLPETIQIELLNPVPSNIPSGWLVLINDRLPSEPNNEKIVGSEVTTWFYLNVSAPSEYLDEKGNMDPEIKNTTAGSEIQFMVRVQSKGYPDSLYDICSCKVIMLKQGYISIVKDKRYGYINISESIEASIIPRYTDGIQTEYYEEYSILLRYHTNSEDDLKVLVTLDDPSDLGAAIMQGGTIITDTTITLIPCMDQDVKLRVYAHELEPYGIYLNSLRVMDENGNIELNRTEVKTPVEKNYNIRLTEVINETYSRIVDPNQMTSDNQKETFEVTLENYGNWHDEVSLDWEENRDSPNTNLHFEDLISIYDKQNPYKSVDSVIVPAYNFKSRTPGTVELLFEIENRQEEDDGEYWFDLIAHSSAPRSYEENLMRSDFKIEDKHTFKIDYILPELNFEVDEISFLRKDGTPIKDFTDHDTRFYEGETIGLFLVIQNTGEGPARDISVVFTVTIDNVPYSTSSDIITADPYEIITLTFYFILDEKGMYYLKAQIDPNNELLGDDQRDNTWNTYISIKDLDSRPPDPMKPYDPYDNTTYEKKKKPDDSDIISSFFSSPVVMTVTITIVMLVLIIAFIIVMYMFTHRKRGGRALPPQTLSKPPEIMILEVDEPPDTPQSPPPPPQSTSPPPPPPSAEPEIFEFKVEPDAQTGFVEFDILPPDKEDKDISGLFKGDIVCPHCYEINPPDYDYCKYCSEKMD